MLIFEPQISSIKWYSIEPDHFDEGMINFDSGWKNALKALFNTIEISGSIAYLFPHCGDKISEEITLIDKSLLAKLGETIIFMPEQNDMMLKAAKYSFAQNKNIRHLLLCDTAFFTDLPEYASRYAVPDTLFKKGIKRYGGHGLTHSWVWDKTSSSDPCVTKLISVLISDNTNVAAVENGVPKETTIGFTSIEGILSATGCGDVDPTILFQIHSMGLTFDNINQLLTKNSGFTGLLGRKTTLADILSGDDSEKEAVRQLYIYSIAKYIGAFIAVLGGVNAVSFFSGTLNDNIIRVVTDISKYLKFIGAAYTTPADDKLDFHDLTAPGSKVKLCLFRQEKWKIINEKCKIFLKQY